MQFKYNTETYYAGESLPQFDMRFIASCHLSRATYIQDLSNDRPMHFIDPGNPRYNSDTCEPLVIEVGFISE